MQQTMKGQHTKLSLHGMAHLDRLTGRNSRSNHDIAEVARLIGGKRQDVCYAVFSPETAVERTDAGV